MEHPKNLGMMAEQFVMDEIEEHGVAVVNVNSWYDLEVGPRKVKVEVKSAELSVRNGMKPKSKQAEHQRTIGRFDFTEQENRTSHRKEDVWYCFVLRHRDACMILGFLRAKQFASRKRYVGVHDVCRKNERTLFSLADFLQEIRLCRSAMDLIREKMSSARLKNAFLKYEELLAECDRLKISQTEMQECIDRLKRDGEIFEPKKGYLSAL